MARCIMNEKKTKKLSQQLGLPIEIILVRGDTDHRKDLYLTGGKIIHLYKNGTMKESKVKWVQN